MSSRFIVTTTNTCMHPTHVHDRPTRPMSPDSRYSQPERPASAIRKQCTYQIRTTASNHVIPSLSTKTSSSLTSSGTSDVRRQDEQLEYVRSVPRSKLCVAPARIVDIVNTMIVCTESYSRHPIALLRSGRSGTVPYPHTPATIPYPRNGLRPVATKPRTLQFSDYTATGPVPFVIIIVQPIHSEFLPRFTRARATYRSPPRPPFRQRRSETRTMRRTTVGLVSRYIYQQTTRTGTNAQLYLNDRISGQYRRSDQPLCITILTLNVTDCTVPRYTYRRSYRKLPAQSRKGARLLSAALCRFSPIAGSCTQHHIPFHHRHSTNSISYVQFKTNTREQAPNCEHIRTSNFRTQ